MCQDKLSRTCLRLVPMHILEAIVEEAEDIQCSDLSGAYHFPGRKIACMDATLPSSAGLTKDMAKDICNAGLALQEILAWTGACQVERIAMNRGVNFTSAILWGQPQLQKHC